MSTPEHFQTLARYNRWMNERLFACCAEIPDAARREDRGAFFHSIHGTLNHGLLGDRLWLGRFRDAPFTVASLDEELFHDFDTLRAERVRTDEDIQAWTADLRAEALAEPFAFRSLSPGADHRFPLHFLVTHFFNHQTHHRGQLTTLISQYGLDPGVTDLLWLPGAELL